MLDGRERKEPETGSARHVERVFSLFEMHDPIKTLGAGCMAGPPGHRSHHEAMIKHG